MLWRPRNKSRGGGEGEQGEEEMGCGGDTRGPGLPYFPGLSITPFPGLRARPVPAEGPVSGLRPSRKPPPTQAGTQNSHCCFIYCCKHGYKLVK